MQISNRSVIRFLSGLSFLIFFCPFFQMCSDKEIKEAPLSKTVIANPNDYTKEELNNFKKEQAEENRLRILNTKKEYTFSIYKIIYSTFFKDKLNFNEFIEGFNQIDFYGILSYVFILLNSIILFFNSVLNKLKIVANLSFLNITFLFLSILFFYLKDGLLEEFNQIKIGYYLFLLNSILIIYFCRKELKIGL